MGFTVEAKQVADMIALHLSFHLKVEGMNVIDFMGCPPSSILADGFSHLPAKAV